eukprot:7345329-Prymnesium_polylepis.1
MSPLAVLGALALPAAQPHPLRVRLGYFPEAQPFQVACARGWFSLSGYEVACSAQATGNEAAGRLDSEDLDLSVLGSTPFAQAVSRGIDLQGVYLVHSKGDSQVYIFAATLATDCYVPTSVLTVERCCGRVSWSERQATAWSHPAP